MLIDIRLHYIFEYRPDNGLSHSKKYLRVNTIQRFVTRNEIGLQY